MRKTKNPRTYNFSDFYCTQCSCKSVPIVRKAGQQREPGHLKKLYCLHCQKETNHVEIRYPSKYTLDDFWIEFTHNNFTKEGTRKEPWRQFVSKIRQEEERKNE